MRTYREGSAKFCSPPSKGVATCPLTRNRVPFSWLDFVFRCCLGGVLLLVL